VFSPVIRIHLAWAGGQYCDKVQGKPTFSTQNLRAIPPKVLPPKPAGFSPEGQKKSEMERIAGGFRPVAAVHCRSAYPLRTRVIVPGSHPVTENRVGLVMI